MCAGNAGIEVGVLADAVVEVRRGGRSLALILSTIAGCLAVWVRGLDQQFNLLIVPPVLLTDSRLALNSAPQ